MGNKHINSTVMARNHATILVAGNFTSAGTLAPTVSTGSLGFGVTRAATGSFVVTLSDSYPVLLGAAVDLMSLTSNNSVVQSTPPTGTVVQSFTVNNWSITTGNQTLVDLPPGNQVHMVLAFNNSSFKP